MKEIQKSPIDPLKVAWSRKWAILLFILTVTVTTFFASTFIPNLYESKSTVLIAPPMFNIEKPKSFFSIESYKDLAMTSGVLQGTIDRLEPNYTDIKNSLYPETLENMVSIQTGVSKFKGGEFKSALISFKVIGRDPNLIKDIANTMPNLLLEKIEIAKSEKTSDMRLISAAITPNFPVWPNKLKIILIAIVASLVVGMAIALAKEHLDNIN